MELLLLGAVFYLSFNVALCGNLLSVYFSSNKWAETVPLLGVLVINGYILYRYALHIL